MPDDPRDRFDIDSGPSSVLLTCDAHGKRVSRHDRRPFPHIERRSSH
ncbi:TPA: hypothetical protein QDC35_002756 [Burkholderia aenigmatica]|nr:hypothetical protein [Burkholderia aenigmatica]